MINTLMKYLNLLLEWLTPTQEQVDAAIYTAMWVDGYTDAEIELEISSFDEEK